MPDTIIARRDTILALLSDPDVLLAKRDKIVKALAPLRALYGNGSNAGERELKLVEARIASAIRAQWDANGEKCTEPKLDAAVRQHPEYIEALTRDVQRRTEWIEKEEALLDIDWRLRCRQSDASLLAAEARLTPSIP